MDPNTEALSDEERREVLYRTLDRLRTAAGIRDPHVEFAEPRRHDRAPVRLGGTFARYRVIVSEEAFALSEQARAWHLASTLSWWTTPRARWRHRVNVALLVVGAGVWTGIFVAVLADRLPQTVLFVGSVLLVLLGPFVVVNLLAWRQRALDEGGIDLLSAAGYDPGSSIRAALGDEPRPNGWRRSLSPGSDAAALLATAADRSGRPPTPLP